LVLLQDDMDFNSWANFFAILTIHSSFYTPMPLISL
jgi:hypothetical protein